MSLRKRFLPSAWYPDDSASAAREIDSRFDSLRGSVSPPRSSMAVVAPHAAWQYSGDLAALAISTLRADAGTVIVFGGHLPSGSPPAMPEEDGFYCPLGTLRADAEFRDALSARFDFAPDRRGDNTVEIQLPFIARRLPEALFVCLRVPSSMLSYEIGKAAASVALSLGRVAVAVGSTDLTHYGPNYGFSPMGEGRGALEWVKGTNDARFIASMLEGNAEEALRRAEAEGSACSPGAAVAALGFAEAMGCAKAALLGYSTSYDIAPASSFVGYAALSWESR